MTYPYLDKMNDKYHVPMIYTEKFKVCENKILSNTEANHDHHKQHGKKYTILTNLLYLIRTMLPHQLSKRKFTDLT